MSTPDRDDVRAEARELAEEARGIRRALDAVSAGATLRRRRSAFLLALGIFAAIQAHDQHLDRCGTGPTPGVAAREEIAEQVTEDHLRLFVCDATFPFHDHGNEGEILANVLGASGYAVAFGGGYLWVQRARRRADRPSG